MMKQELLMEVKYDERGLVPVVTQDALTGSVLMLSLIHIWPDGSRYQCYHPRYPGLTVSRFRRILRCL